MQIITSHINADFDSLASMIAAQRVYPEAKLVFPGSLETNLRSFLKKPEFQIPHLKLKDISMDKITLLVLVDTKLAARIGEFAKIINQPQLHLHIYDHHPSQEKDLHGSLELIKPYGSTATIFAELFQQKGLMITPQEATILALGIYEDTGSLTYPSTTIADLQSVAYLLSCGANLNLIADYINQDLTAEQISVLNRLLHSLEKYTIQGIEISLASTSIDEYSGDVAILAHKIRDMENINVLFILVQVDDRIHLVARSRISQVDVGEIAEFFGGGGHYHAASATIRGQPMAQLKENLFETIRRCIQPAITARDIMSTPIKSIPETITIAKGKETFHRYNVNTLPVLDPEGKMAGLITRQTVDRAIRHGMGNSLVSDFMQSDLITIDQGCGIDYIREYMVESNQRFLPVMEKEKLVGAITKTDLLRALHEHMSQQSFSRSPSLAQSVETQAKNISSLLYERLPESILNILKMAGDIADQLRVSAYVVGGFVRDLLLRVDNFDLDIVVEGNGIQFAKHLAREIKGRIRAYQRFGTAVVVFPNRFKVDVATARTEYYEKPVALPHVELSSLKHDLYRRDFTINTLAIQLNARRFGHLIDFFGGRRDLKDKKIRVLHSLSFIEDPTRVFRAIRFEQRYGFKIGKNTLNLLNNTIKMDLLLKLEGYRIFGELYLILREDDPVRAIDRMEKLGLLPFIHPHLHEDGQVYHLLVEIKKVIDWYTLLYLETPIRPWLLYFIGLTDRLTEEESIALWQKFQISQKYQPALLQIKIKHQMILRELARSGNIKPSRIYDLLSAFSLETLLFTMAKSPNEEIRKNISHYLTTLRSVKVSITGDDLKSMGYQPGPIFRKILADLMELKMDGKINTSQDEVEYVKEKYPL